MGRLLAVMVLDIVGSTDLLEEHGVRTAIAVRRSTDDLVSSAIDGGSGEVVDTNGDGITVVFDSCTEALEVANTIQRKAKVAGLASPQIEAQLRIGVDVGEVTIAGRPIGCAVTEAERLCDAALPGSVKASEAATGLRALDQSGTERTLRAVVFADLEIDETARSMGALANQQLSQGVFVGPTASNLGSIVDSNGNGIVALFPSCTSAVTACQSMQRRLERLDVPIRMRIGISVGDVSFAEGDAYGATVVEAARLEKRFKADELLLTQATAKMASLLMGLKVDGPEELHLKGFERPTSVHRCRSLTSARQPVELPVELDSVVKYQVVGRNSVLAQTKEIWDLAKSGVSQLLLLSGSQGAGKSRIASELAKQAHDEGALVLYGACQPELAIPYHPIATALGRISQLDPELTNLFSTSQSDPTSLVEGHTPTDHTADRHRLFNSIVAVFERLSVEQPVVVVLDDLHWATTATIDLLTYLTSTISAAPILFLGTLRHDEVDHSDDALTTLVDGSGETGPRRNLTLGALSKRDISLLLAPHAVQSGAAAQETEPVARFVAETTGGNPLYVEETLAHLQQTQSLVKVGETWQLQHPVEELTAPDSIVEMATGRVRRLSPTLADILAVAALRGETFEVEAVSIVAQVGVEETLDQLELAQEAGLARESAEPGRYLFANALIATAMRGTLSATRRALLHQRMAEAIESLWPSKVDELLFHWGHALGPKSAERKTHYLRLVGERDVAAFAWSSASKRFSSILELLQSPSGQSFGAAEDLDRQRAQTHLALGQAQRAVGDPAFRDSMLAAADISRRTGQSDCLAAAAIGMLRPGHWNSGACVVYDDVVELLEDALFVLEEDDPLRVQVLTGLATALTYAEDPARRIQYLDQAKELATSLKTPYFIGLCLVTELFVSNAPTQRHHRNQLCEQLARIGRATANPDFRFIAGFFQAVAGLEIGDLGELDRRLASIEPDLEQTQNYWYESLVVTLQTAIDIIRCVPNMGEIVDANLQRFIETPHDTEGVWTVQHGLIAYHAGTLGELIAPLETALDDASELPWETGLALGRMQRGDLELATEVFKYERDFDEYWLAAMHAKASIAFRVRDRDVCRDLFDRLLPFRSQVAFVSRGSTVAGPIATSLGQAAFVLDELDLAEELLRESLAQAENMATWFFVAEAKYGLSLVLFARDDASPEAHELIASVADISQTYGFQWHQRQAESLMNDTRLSKSR